MRQTIFTLLMCITASLMHGNIIFTDISPDTVIQPPSNNTYDGRFSVDMNGNGQDDYRFVSTFGSSSRSARIILNMFNSTTGEYNEAIFLPGFNTDSVKPLAYNTNIAASSTGWVGRANFNPNIWEAAAPNFMGLGDKYIGVGFHIAGVIHYGWIHVNLDNNRVLTVRGFAYEDQPGVAILAGVGPVPATSVSVQGQGGVTTIPVLGNSLQMEATIMPANATVQQVAWSVTNGSGAATISPSGLLTAVSGGTVTVTATTTDGSNLAANTVIVIGSSLPVRSINMSSQANVRLINTPNGTLQLLAQVMPLNAGNQNVTWSVSAGSSLATISTSGLVTAIDNGVATFRATSQDGTNVFGEIDITIRNQNLPITAISIYGDGNFTSIVDPGGTLQIRAIISPVLAANKSLSWTVDNLSGIASINSSGLLQAQGDGTVRVRATALDGSGRISPPLIIEIYNQTISNEQDLVSDYQLSPNPVQDILSLKADPTVRIRSIKIYSYNGQLVQNPLINYSMSQHQINLANLKAGIYMVHIIDENGRKAVHPISKL